MVRNPTTESGRLVDLFRSEHQWIFHHAYFDLGFIKADLRVDLDGPVHCTKVLTKIVSPTTRSGLGSACRDHLNIHLNKKIVHGQWGNETLSKRQIEYAAADVLVLHPLFKHLHAKLTLRQLVIYANTMEGIKAKVVAELEGYTDLFDYRQENSNASLSNRAWWMLNEKHKEGEITK
jgi:ribonuclease D